MEPFIAIIIFIVACVAFGLILIASAYIYKSVKKEKYDEKTFDNIKVTGIGFVILGVVAFFITGVIMLGSSG